MRWTENVTCTEKKLTGGLGVGGRIILKLAVIMWVEEVWVDSYG
jgi:hypothetical protein